MSLTAFNVVTNLANVNCQGVSFSVQGGQFASNQTPILFSNGMQAITHECLKDVLSYKSNNKTTLFLTDLTKFSKILTDKQAPQNIGVLTEIESPVTAQSVFNSPIGDDNYQVIKLQSTGTFFEMVTSDYTKISQTDVFQFIFQSDNSVIVQALQNKYLLTSYGVGQPVIFQPTLSPVLSTGQTYTDAQRFDYALGTQTITLYQIDDIHNLPRFQNAIVKFPTGVYGLSSLAYLTSSTPFPAQAAINFISYVENPKLNSDIKDSFLVKYDVNPLTDQSTLTVNVSTQTEEYTQNFLGLFPHEYLVQGANSVICPLAIHGLKNYQTPEYNYSFGFDYIQGQNGVRRTYENIYTGTNQYLGSDNVYLGFKADTIEINFPSDQETAFYFGPTSESVPLSSAGLIEDGAIAGEVPFTSDKIYLKLKNYNELIPDASQPTSIPRYSNTWLCSWLSGSMAGDKIWLDRYYNPAYYTVDQALSTKVMQYHDRLYAGEDYTFDIPSEMILEGGALYRYFHVGRNNRLNFIQHLTSSSILQVTKWDTSPLVDESPNANEGILYFNNPDNLQGDYINLDGTNHVLFPATTKLLTNSQMTVSLFVNTNDWQNITSNQIFGNYYNNGQSNATGSGFGLINDSALTTPIITLCDTNTNKIYNLNYRFAILQNNLYLSNSTFTGNKIIQRLPNYSYWVFDTVGRGGIKYDVNDSPVFDTTKNSVVDANFKGLYRIDQVEINGDQNLYIYDNTLKKYLILDQNGNLVGGGGGTVPVNTNSIQIDLSGNLIPCFGTQSTIDNNNSIWEIVGGNLYKNKVIFGNIGNVQELAVDADNYLWVLSSQDTVSKIDTVNHNIIFSYRIGLKSSLPVDPCFNYNTKSRFISFLRVPKDSYSNACNITTSLTEDRAIIIDLNDKQIYILDINGNIVTKLSLYGLTNNSKSNLISYGDFTGYEFLRKYNFINKVLSWKLNIAHPDGTNSQIISLPYNINNLSKGWHNFVISFDSQKGIVSTYLDSILINQQTFTPNLYQLYYLYRTSLLLGCETIKNTTLNDIISIDDGYKFTGKVAELRLYNKSLTQGEIEQLYFSSQYAANDRPLIWNMSVGNRNYIEQIKHWFKFQMPGSKSKYFNINIHNLDVPDNVKPLIESGIKSNISKIAPANTSLYKINWI